MPEFHLAFTPDLSSITAPDGRVTLYQQPTRSEAVVETFDAEALAALHSIAGKLSDLESLLKHEMDSFRQRTARVAIDVARAVLNDDEPLLHQRIENYVQIAFDQLQPGVPKTIRVHPTCVDPIMKWLGQTEHESIEIESDTSVLPGDCQIETGETGIAATLDAFLESAFKQLSEDGTSSAS